jgi:hypothetical protein
MHDETFQIGIKPLTENVIPEGSSDGCSTWDGLPRIEFKRAMIDRGAPFVPVDAAGWRRVRLGLTFILWGLLSPPFLAILWAIAFHFFSLDPPQGAWKKVSKGVGVALLAIPPILFMAGLIACASAPRRGMARGFGIGALALFCVAFFCLAASFVPAGNLAPPDRDLFRNLAVILASLHCVAFCLFLRSVALTVDFGRRPVGPNWLAALTSVVAVCVCLQRANEFAADLGVRSRSDLDGIFWLVVAIHLGVPLLLAISVAFLIAVWRVRSAISAYLAP